MSVVVHVEGSLGELMSAFVVVAQESTLILPLHLTSHLHHHYHQDVLAGESSPFVQASVQHPYFIRSAQHRFC